MRKAFVVLLATGVMAGTAGCGHKSSHHATNSSSGSGASTAAQTSSGSCSPKSKKGNCYKPGELCPHTDHGAKGTTSTGQKIVCKDKDGWRWELS